MLEGIDTEIYPVVSVICRSPLIHVEVDFKLSLAPLSRHDLIFEPSGQELTQYLDSTNVAFAARQGGCELLTINIVAPPQSSRRARRRQHPSHLGGGNL